MDSIIPADICKYILLKLPIDDMITVGSVCKAFTKLLTYKILWLEKLQNEYPSHFDCIDNPCPFEKLMFLTSSRSINIVTRGITISLVNFSRAMTLKDLLIDVSRRYLFVLSMGIFDLMSGSVRPKIDSQNMGIVDLKSRSVSLKLEIDSQKFGTRFWQLSYDNGQVTFKCTVYNIKYTYPETSPLYKVTLDEARKGIGKDLFSCLENVHI